MPALADPATSRALLVGTHEYKNLETLAAVSNNLSALHRALTDRGLWGLPVNNCRVLSQPSGPADVMEALEEFTSAATDTLLVYFAGHGLVDPYDDEELYLALRDTDKKRLYTALSYNWIRREVYKSTALRKIVILDCCFSGRALGTWMGESDAEVTDRLEIEGTCVLTATARSRLALAPTSARYTAFTGELLSTLLQGVPQGPELLDMDTVYRAVKVRMRAKNYPIPQQGHLNGGGDIPLVRNRAALGPSGREATIVEAPADGPEELPPRIEPVSEPIGPILDWRSALAVGSEPVEIRRPTEPRKVRSGTWRLMAYSAVWAALSTWAVTGHFAAWLPLSMLAAGTVCIAGFAMGWMTSGDEIPHGYLAFSAYMTGSGALIAAMILGPVAALGLTVYAEIAIRPLEQRVLIGVAFFTLLGCILAAVEESDRREKSRESRAMWKRATALSDGRLSKRWLADQPDWEPEQSLISALLPIRAARFVRPPTAGAEFVAVAGDRVLLVWRLRWRPGRYTLGHGGTREIFRDGVLDRYAVADARRITDRSAAWRKLVLAESETAQIRPVVIIDGFTGKARPSIGFRHDGFLTYITAEEFGDSAGGFLVKGQQFIDALLLANALRLRYW